MLANKRLRIKLQSIEYLTCDLFDIEILSHLRNFLVWVEDRKIRALLPKDRVRDIKGNDWEYLEHVECPYNELDPWALVDWFISKSVLLDCEANGNSFNNDKSTNSNHENEHFFQNIDVESEEFRQSVVKLARMLSIPLHSDNKQIFKAICLVIEQKLDTDVLNNAIKDYGTYKIDMLKLDDICLGFDIDDVDVKHAAIALRLMNVIKLRRLQDQANTAIVRVQQLTADPKTDEKLGQVGF